MITHLEYWMRMDVFFKFEDIPYRAIVHFTEQRIGDLTELSVISQGNGKVMYSPVGPEVWEVIEPELMDALDLEMPDEPRELTRSEQLDLKGDVQLRLEREQKGCE